MATNTENIRTKQVSNIERSEPGKRAASWQNPLVWGELLLLGLLVTLGIIVHLVSGPLPGDAGLERAWQKLVLPHQTLTKAIEFASTVNWPNPALVGVIVFVLGLLLLRRWAAAVAATFVTAMGDASSFLTNQLVQRPRPTGHGIDILQQINSYYSFPSGHVVHVIAFFGFILFVTFQVKHHDWWLWILRLPLILLLALIGPSRVLEGEHWPSDVLGGLLLGAFWLVAGILAYKWLHTIRLHLHAPHFTRDTNAQLGTK